MTLVLGCVKITKECCYSSLKICIATSSLPRPVVLNLQHSLKSPARLIKLSCWNPLKSFWFNRSEIGHFPKWRWSFWFRNHSLRTAVLEYSHHLTIFSNMLLKLKSFMDFVFMSVNTTNLYHHLDWLPRIILCGSIRTCKTMLLIVDTSIILGIHIITLTWTVLPWISFYSNPDCLVISWR